jgi:hypothetical protein
VGQQRQPTGDLLEKQKRFVFFYLMRNDPVRVRVLVSRHVSHWRGLELAHYLGGPFEDRTGGLITFESDESTALHAVDEDPFIKESLVEAHWLKSWMPE